MCNTSAPRHYNSPPPPIPFIHSSLVTTSPPHTLTECLSEAVKLLKAEYLVKAINTHKMDQAILFCRTKLDCDNIEHYLLSLGGGKLSCEGHVMCGS